MQLLTLFVYCRRDDGFHHLKIGDDGLVGQWRFCSLHRNNQLPSNFVFYVSQGLIPYDVSEPRHRAFVPRDRGRLHWSPPLLAEDASRTYFLEPPVSLFSEGGQRPRDFVEGLNGVNARCEDVLTQLALGYGPSHLTERYGQSLSRILAGNIFPVTAILRTESFRMGAASFLASLFHEYFTILTDTAAHAFASPPYRYRWHGI